VTRTRIIVPGATTAITRRTTHRKLLLTPFTELIERAWLDFLGRAQEKYGVLLHHGTLQGNHGHTTVTPTKDNLPEFLRYLHRAMARFVQELLLEHGYDAPSCVWDERPTHLMRCVDAGAALAWILYCHLNPVAAGLVERAQAYPGFLSDLGLLKGGLIVVERPPLYVGEDEPREVATRFSPVPMLARSFGGDLEGAAGGGGGRRRGGGAAERGRVGEARRQTAPRDPARLGSGPGRALARPSCAPLGPGFHRQRKRAPEKTPNRTSRARPEAPNADRRTRPIGVAAALAADIPRSHRLRLSWAGLADRANTK
jgi:hypothetical protein